MSDTAMTAPTTGADETPTMVIELDAEDEAVVRKMFDILLEVDDPKNPRKRLHWRLTGDELNRVQRMTRGE